VLDRRQLEHCRPDADRQRLAADLEQRHQDQEMEQ
jgi:hypothetical protein